MIINTFANVSVMVPILFFYIFFFEQALDVDFTRFIEFVLFFLLNILIDDIVDLLVSHVILFNFVGNFVEYCFVSDSNSEQSLFELVKTQTRMILSWDLLIFGQSPENGKDFFGSDDQGSKLENEVEVVPSL